MPRGGEGRGPGRPGAAGNGAKASGLPPWAIPAGVGVVVLLILLMVLRSCGGGGRSDAGECLEELAAHLPASSTTISGTDLIRARSRGFDDTESLDVLGETKLETGAIPDAVTYNFRMKNGLTAERARAQTGVSASDIDCSLAAGTSSVMSGSFDPAEVEGADAGARGRLAATEDRLALTSGRPQPATLLEPARDEGMAGDEAVLAVLASLRESEAYSVVVQVGDGEDDNGRPLAAGIGSARDGDERSVALAWAFADEKAAKSGRPGIVDRVNSTLQGYVSIRESDLTVEGSLATAVIPTTRAPDLQSLLDDPTFRLVTAPG